MAVFDRSWYGRVLVERVEGFATDAQWQRAYGEICEFERTLADDGMIFVKLWMHISHEEQERRFKRRADDPLKAWKLGPEDWRNREKRGPYEAALRDMLKRTHTAHAPWDVIEAEDKRWARVRSAETVIARIEEGMRRQGFEPPERLPAADPQP
jgi:polyphosphate kinase 2 (PPK2 family)